jgi:hypothetical protein
MAVLSAAWHHFIDLADVADIKNDEIRLSKNRT